MSRYGSPSNRRLGAFPAALVAAIGVWAYKVPDTPAEIRWASLFFACCILVLFLIDRVPEFERFVTGVMDKNVRRLREIQFMDSEQLQFAGYMDVTLTIEDEEYTIRSNGRVLTHMWIINYLRQCRGSRELPSLGMDGNDTAVQKQRKALIYWMMGGGRKWVVPVEGKRYMWAAGYDADKVIEYFQILAGERW